MAVASVGMKELFSPERIAKMVEEAKRVVPPRNAPARAPAESAPAPAPRRAPPPPPRTEPVTPARITVACTCAWCGFGVTLDNYRLPPGWTKTADERAGCPKCSHEVRKWDKDLAYRNSRRRRVT